MKSIILNHSKRLTACLTALAILLASLVISLPLTGFSANAAISYWDGKAADSFAGGDGSETKPYLIENGGQLYKAINDLGKTNGTASHYLLTADIYLNEGYENYEKWGESAPANKWLPTANVNAEFVGSLDGNGHTVYGLYAEKSDWRLGLIIRTGNGSTTIANLNLANAYLKSESSTVGGIVGMAYSGTTVSKCTVHDSIIDAAATDVAAIVGAGNNSVIISNCASYDVQVKTSGTPAGIVGRAWSWHGVTLSDSFSAGNYPVGGNVQCNNVFTDTTVTDENVGVSVLDNEKMKGAGAAARMNLSPAEWQDTDGYPVPVIQKAVGVWDGNISTGFAGGEGTAEAPYLIETGSQLYKAVNDLGKKADGSPAYYLITSDIILNKDYENYKNWEPKTYADRMPNAPANNWEPPTRGDFIGHIDGGFHTIYGLYAATTKWRDGLIPYMNGDSTVSNLTIAYSCIYNDDNSAGGITGDMYGNSSIDKCIVHDTLLSSYNSIVGGIAGGINTQSGVNPGISISNCGTYNLTIKTNKPGAAKAEGGILAKVSTNSGVKMLSNCYSAGYFPLGIPANTECNNCYTDAEGTYKGVNVIESSKMKGAGAVANMKLPVSVWVDTEDSYPTFNTSGDEITVWDGSTATSFAGGNGTEASPYEIANGGQLFKAINDLGKKADGSAAYYIVTSDIVLNDNYENYEAWGNSAPTNRWNPARGSNFIGSIDGDFHTVYGLYTNDDAWRSGLIPFMGSSASVSNLTLAYAYIRNNNITAGGITGQMYNNTKIDKCIVHDAVISAPSNIGGIAGGTNQTGNVINVNITNCGTYNLKLICDEGSEKTVAGILAKASTSVGPTNVTNCYSAGYFPFGDPPNNITCRNSYTDKDGPYKYGVTKLENSKMKGEGAVANMNLPEGEWDDTETYPIPVKSKEVAGSVWSGVAATKFAGGSGTIYDPYIIETASQLYKAIADLGLKADGSPAYYSVTEDIILNKDYANYKTWGTNKPANNWLPINAGVDFQGNLDGNGHTVYGLYTEKESWAVGLIARARGAVVRDLNLSNAYITTPGGTVGGIVGMLYANSKVMRCTVHDTVIDNQSTSVAAGIVGSGDRNVAINSCASYDIEIKTQGDPAGIFGRAWSNAQLFFCYSAGYYTISPTEPNRTETTDCYTDTKSFDHGGVWVVKNADMKGKDALKKMPNLLTSMWLADDNGYPVFRSYNDGKKGEIWSGAIAENYAGGDGSENNPFIIETGEQLYKFVVENSIIGSVPKHYKITADIALNNTDGDNWQTKKDLNKWYYSQSFNCSIRDHLDGAGHVVFGLYTENNCSPVYAGLIPVIDTGAVIENVGVTRSSVNTTPGLANNFSAAVVGYIDDWDSGLSSWEDSQIPVVRQCFGDTTVILNGKSCGGIVGGVSAPVLVENCYYTGKFNENAGYASIIGNVWTKGSKISHCYAATEAMCEVAGGQSIRTLDLAYEAVYNFGRGMGDGLHFASLYDMRGEKAKETLSELDFDNVWKTVENGTPVLRVFGDAAEKYSSTEDAYATISFNSNVEGLTVPSITGKIGSPVKLPTPKREGYKFDGWYVYVELQCEYTYTTYPYIDLLLYAKWVPTGFEQDFENYPNTEYDMDSDYVYFRPGVADYDASKIHGGNKAFKRVGDSAERQDFLVKYEEELEVGKEYTIAFWMMTDKNGATGKVSLVNATWPDIAEPIKGAEVTLAQYKNLKAGEWKLYKCKFTAKTKWISLRTDGNTPLYFDDILVYPSK